MVLWELARVTWVNFCKPKYVLLKFSFLLCTYADGFWDAEDIVELTCRTMKNGIYRIYMNPWNRFLNFLECYFFNLQSKEQCWEVGQKHYDTGILFMVLVQNCLFQTILNLIVLIYLCLSLNRK